MVLNYVLRDSPLVIGKLYLNNLNKQFKRVVIKSYAEVHEIFWVSY